MEVSKMSLVKMKNLLGNEISIPRGAVKSYESLGFEEVIVVVEEVDTQEDTREEDLLLAQIIEIEEKPISNWSKEEVKLYADHYEIELTGTKNVNEAKERIKNFMSAKK
jgi:hypothetical protein